MFQSRLSKIAIVAVVLVIITVGLGFLLTGNRGEDNDTNITNREFIEGDFRTINAKVTSRNFTESQNLTLENEGPVKFNGDIVFIGENQIGFINDNSILQVGATELTTSSYNVEELYYTSDGFIINHTNQALLALVQFEFLL